MSQRPPTPQTARTAAQFLTDRGIKHPKAVGDALAALDRVEAQQPDPASPDSIVAAFLDGSPGKPQQAALDVLAADLLTNAWRQACAIAAQAVADALLAERDTIHAALATQAAEYIGRLTAVADLGTTTLDCLVREGRHDDAEAFAVADLDAAALQELYNYRDRHLTRRREVYGSDWINVGVWRDPRATTGTTTLLDGLRRGGQLWYPTVAEATAHAAPITEELRAAAQAEHNAAANVGGLTAW